jgi:threonine synthase
MQAFRCLGATSSSGGITCAHSGTAIRQAFDEMQALGWICKKRPRMVAVLTTGCCPIVRAREQGHTEIETPWPDIRTKVHGVRVAKALGDFLILRVIYESSGFGSAVDDEDVECTRLEVAAADGTLLSPEGAVCVAAYHNALQSGKVRRDERAVIFNTAIGLRADMPAKQVKLDAARPFEHAAL